MRSKINIKIVVITAAVCMISLFFINMSLAANTGKVTVETANLRETPDENSKILELLSINKEVEIVEKTNNWYKVQVDGITGYLREDIISVDGQTSENKNVTSTEETNQVQPAETNTQEVKSNETNITTGKKQIVENVNLKILPVINSISIMEVKKDEQVNVIEIVNGWARIEVGAVKGWVRKEKLQDIIAVAQNETTQQEQTQNTVPQEQANTETQQPTTQTVNKTLYVKSQVVNLRRDSNTTSEIVATLSVNTEVNVVEELSNGWSKVKVNGNEGYILNTLLDTKKQETSRSQETSRRAAQQQTTNTATTSTTTAPVASGKGSTVVETAKKYLGSRYVYGGTSPKGFDCSGFTQYVYKLHGVSLSRTSQAQSKNGVAVNRNNLQPGDLVFFYKGISHVGIYIGSGRFIHASSSTTGVITSSLSGHYSSNYVCARRVL